MSYSGEPTASLPYSQQPSTGQYPEPVQSSLHPTALRFFLTILGLSSSLIPSGFLTKILDVCLTTPTHATYPTHFILRNLINFNKYATDRVHTDRLKGGTNCYSLEVYTQKKHYFSHYINMAYINK
jgi:hypothetical protein